MKRPAKKLQLTSEHVRVLTSEQLTTVVGGAGRPPPCPTSGKPSCNGFPPGV